MEKKDKPVWKMIIEKHGGDEKMAYGKSYRPGTTINRWFNREMKWDNNCKVCGKKLEVATQAWMRRGSPHWEFLCDSCHAKVEAEIPTTPDIAKDVSVETIDAGVLEKLGKSFGGGTEESPDDELEDDLTELFEGLDGSEKSPVEPPAEASSGSEVTPKPGTLEYFKQNAMWRV